MNKEKAHLQKPRKSALNADVVLVGGGFCGVTIARLLSKCSPELSVLLVDEHEYFEFTPGIPRAMTDVSVLAKLQIAYAACLSRIVHVRAQVISLTGRKLMTSAGSITAKCFVLCSGASYPVPLTGKNVFVLRKGHDAVELQTVLQSAESVVVIGGGLTGVEVAGELLTKSSAKVTVIEPGARLLGRCPKRASVVAQEFINARGILKLSERVTRRAEGALILGSGASVLADVVLWCGGLGWDFRWLRIACKRNERGALKVNEHLQMEGYPHVFCGGDLSAIDEEKSAQNAERQGKLIARNVVHFLSHKSLLSYQPAKRPMVISLGDWNGILVMKELVISGLLPALLKRCIEKWFLFKLRYL